MKSIWSMVCEVLLMESHPYDLSHSPGDDATSSTPDTFYRNKSSRLLRTLLAELDPRRRRLPLHNSVYKMVSLFLPLLMNHCSTANNSLDLAELEPSRTWKTEFPDPDDILNFTLTIDPDEGMYKGGRFVFTFAVNQNFPHDPPKVLCTQKIYHPNIDLNGKVCLNILREDWKPVLNLNAVIVGLQVSCRCSVEYASGC
jgi:ubiquitin-protein ligase